MKQIVAEKTFDITTGKKILVVDMFKNDITLEDVQLSKVILVGDYPQEVTRLEYKGSYLMSSYHIDKIITLNVQDIR